MADDPRVHLEAFLETHCYECHDDIEAEAGLNLMDLDFDPASRTSRTKWERVFRKVHEGEMPPKENKRPPESELKAFLSGLGRPLLEKDREDIWKNGRVHTRRLTRAEYEYSLHDLLGVGVKLQDALTSDTEEGFANNAAHQQLSHFHIESYLRASDIALEEAFSRALGKDPEFSRTYGKARIAEGLGESNYRGPEPRDGELISWNIALPFYGRMPATKVPEDGWYEITVRNVRGINRGDDGAVWGTLNSGSGQSNEPLQFPIGIVEGTEKPADRTFRAWIREGHCLIMEPAEGGKPGAAANLLGRDGGTVIFDDRNLEDEGYDGLAFTDVSIRRIHPNGDRDAVMARLFPGISVADLKAGPRQPEREARRLLGNFATAAFRRPVTAAQLAPYLELVSTALASGEKFPDAIRQGYHAILCSPNFLTLVEAPGPLDDFAIASRLSYMLWKSVPDEELLRLAASGRLKNPAMLAAQVDRLVDSPKFVRFVESFTGQWLDLDEIDSTQPDPKRFRAFDPVLQQSMVGETQAFVAELFRKNLPVANFLESEFTFLNTRLHDHYGMKETEVRAGEGLQKVKLPGGGRSGLLTQGAVLKVTADGSVTSPVVRGVFVNERILGRHIDPPPPNIPAIEPDIRGAVSVRDQLEKHKSSPNCASCHLKIDPAGFALEEFDPVGSLREFYGKPNKSAKVDATGTTPEGESFRDYDGWKAIQLTRPGKLAEAFAEQLLRYGTGADVRFSDREEVKKIAEEARKSGYGIRSILKGVVSSRVFMEK